MFSWLKSNVLYLSFGANLALLGSLFFFMDRLADARASVEAERLACAAEKMVASAEADSVVSKERLKAEKARTTALLFELKRTREALQKTKDAADDAERRYQIAQGILDGVTDDPENCSNARPDPDTWQRLRHADQN